MRKFGNLIINEYIKVLMKLSTIIMLIAVVVVAAGYNMIMLINNMDQHRWKSYDYYESYDEQIEYQKSSKDEGWENTVKILTYLKEHNITQKYYDDDYWMNTAVYTMFDKKAKAEEYSQSGETEKALEHQKVADGFELVIKNKDWKTFNKLNFEAAQTDVQNFDSESSIFSETKEQLEITLWAAKYRFDHEILPSYSNWQSRLLDEVSSHKYEVSSLKAADPADQDRKTLKTAEEAVLIGEYRLEHNIEINTSKSSGSIDNSYYDKEMGFWDVFATSSMGINVVSVLIIIIAGSVISSEFSSGTVKYLLVNPAKRYKIFLAKYISVLSFAFLMLFIYYVFNMILSGVLFGFGDFLAPYLYVSGGRVVQSSSFLLVASKYLISSVGMICMATFAFAISSISKSSILSIGLGVFLYLSGYGAVAILSELKLDFGRYVIFANLELNTISEGISIYKGQTVPFALGVIGVYMVVFLLTAWDGFVRRDIK